ncbi:MAG: rhodanese-like domain-containing protein [Pseudomonadota bacterium]
MDRLPEFISNHWLLSAAFVILATMLFMTTSRSGGRVLSPSLLGTVVNRDHALLLDIRSDSDFRGGHIAGSLHIPQAQLASRLAELEKHKGKPLVVVCAMGHAAPEAARQLLKAGHSPVYRLAGGVAAWRNENLPVVKA